MSLTLWLEIKFAVANYFVGNHILLVFTHTVLLFCETVHAILVVLVLLLCPVG